MNNGTLAPRLIWEQFLLQYREDSEWIIDQAACGQLAAHNPTSPAGKQWAAWGFYVADLKMKGEL